MSMRQVTLSSRHSERITFRDIEADNDLEAVGKALRQIGGERGWLVVAVCEIRRPENLARNQRTPLELELF